MSSHSFPPLAGSYRRPVFLVGLPRSGTTLLQAVLCANGPYFPMPETHFFSHVARGRGVVDAPTIVRRLRERARIEIEPGLLTGATTKGEMFLRLVASFDTGNAGTFLEKTPRHVFCMDEIAALFPDARFVCLVREPKNMAASNLVAFGRGQSLIRVAVVYNRIVSESERIAATPAGRLVRYEDLVHRPEATVRDLCAFLDVPFHERAMTRFAEVAGKVVAPGETWKDSVTQSQGVRSNEPDKWRATLAASEAALVDILTARAAERLGYRPERVWGPALRGAVADLRLLLHPHQFRRLFDPVDG